MRCRIVVCAAVTLTLSGCILGSSPSAARPAEPCNYYASPAGTGTGASPSSPFKTQDFWAVAGPGKTLCLLDGVYRGAASMIDPPDYLNGAAGKPITVRALNDGKVLIDGEGARLPVFLKYNDYFVLEGFNASRSSGTVVRVIRSKYNVVRRVAAWDAADGNTEIFSTTDSEHTLFEDVAGWGIARKTFSAAYGGNYFTCRRCWGSWDGSHQAGPKMTYTLAYNNYGMLVENSIGTWTGRDMQQSYYLQCPAGSTYSPCNQLFTNYAVDQPYGIFAVDREDGDKNAHSKILGSIAYVTSSDRFHPSQLFLVTKLDSVEIAHSVAYIQPGSYTSKRPFALYGLDSNTTVTNLVARSLIGIGGADSIFYKQWAATHIAVVSTPAEVSKRFSGTYRAEICTRHKDGVLTDEPLWPWPMNQRIIDAMLQSGRPALDVTATIEKIVGPILNRCRQ